jgi:hypothetical protein
MAVRQRLATGARVAIGRLDRLDRDSITSFEIAVLGYATIMARPRRRRTDRSSSCLPVARWDWQSP